LLFVGWILKLLAIDTATDGCGVALLVGDALFHRFQVAPKQHTQLILTMIDELLQEAGITLQDLDVFAFGRGPGSFTGIRIATSVIQGLSFGCDKPVVPVSTLRALAQGVYREQGQTHVFASLDARMQEIYWGLFVVDSEGIMQSITEERVGPKADVQLPEGNWIATSRYPEARDIATIARAEFVLGHFVFAKDALPIYIRDTVVRK